MRSMVEGACGRPPSGSPGSSPGSPPPPRCGEELCLADRPPDALRRRRHVDVADAEFRQRVDQRVHHRRAARRRSPPRRSPWRRAGWSSPAPDGLAWTKSGASSARGIA